ncbi:24062_t:CDS:1 [Cetraspora pellucida]|uniref:24062_t:CDS:1 n=1 Tax=Cetraspora pellucida TaxID=1433469 RepID=A0A9N9JZE0_9GLOM|nr:24062_t:CDS:1 [Cetraspora pellucida]
MAKATIILSSSIRPTMGDLHMIFPIILNVLHEMLNSEMQIKNQVAQRIYKKLDDYWTILRGCCSVSVVLDPNIKMSSFDNETAIIVRERLHNVYTQYIGKEINNTSFAKNDSPRDYFRKHYTEKSKNNPLEEYLTTPEENCNPLDFWKQQSTNLCYAGLTQMA